MYNEDDILRDVLASKLLRRWRLVTPGKKLEDIWVTEDTFYYILEIPRPLHRVRTIYSVNSNEQFLVKALLDNYIYQITI